LAITWLILAPSASAYTFGGEVVQNGSKQTVFDYSMEPRCGGDPYFFQDTPSRVIRDPSDEWSWSCPLPPTTAG